MNKSAPRDPREVLADSEASLSQTISALSSLEENSRHSLRGHSVGISSNVTVDLLGVYLRKHAILNEVLLDISIGNYDDLLGDAKRFSGSGVQTWIIIPFFDNLLPFFESRLDYLDPAAIDAKEAELCARFEMAFSEGKKFGEILVSSFHRMSSADIAGPDIIRQVLDRFNASLHDIASRFSNVRMIDLDSAISTVGRRNAFDRRFYLKAKAPYAASTLNEFARNICNATRGFGGYFYKALILDCDNTLWGGIIGEDLLDGIKLSPYDYPGNIFWHAQSVFAALEHNGVLICLCSKNNPEDVADVFRRHPEMLLRDRQIVIKKINWNDKVSNLQEIAQELNIGLDSLVFLDDSPFECEAVRSQLPMVRTFQVPANISEYSVLLASVRDLFLGRGISSESKGKTEQYRLRAEAEQLRARSGNQEEYLRSLGLKVEIVKNATQSVARISELSQKSNQFNLTTKRYGESDILQLMGDPNAAVFSLTVSDKFGNHGLTGVVIMSYRGEVASVDAFLMSCRVIGRGIEFAIWDSIFHDARLHHCKQVVAEYMPSLKNAQVADFFDRLGLTMVAEKDGAKRYKRSLETQSPYNSSWIEVKYVG